MERSGEVTCYSRWSSPKAFSEESDSPQWDDAKISVAMALNITFAKFLNDVMGSDRNVCLKLTLVILIDATMLLTTPLVAVIECVVRLALAIVTLPLYLCCKFVEPSLFEMAYNSLWQVPNSLYTAYLSLTTKTIIYAGENGMAMARCKCD